MILNITKIEIMSISSKLLEENNKHQKMRQPHLAMYATSVKSWTYDNPLCSIYLHNSYSEYFQICHHLLYDL